MKKSPKFLNFNIIYGISWGSLRDESLTLEGQLLIEENGTILCISFLKVKTKSIA